MNASSLNVGDTHEEVLVEDLKRTQLVMYSGASGDYNLLHRRPVLQRGAGYPGVFAHGMLSMADWQYCHEHAAENAQVWRAFCQSGMAW